MTSRTPAAGPPPVDPHEEPGLQEDGVRENGLQESGPGASDAPRTSTPPRSTTPPRTGVEPVPPARHARASSGGLGAWLKETVLIVASALVLSLLIKTFLVQAFYIPSGSMEDTLQVGDRVLVSKLAPGPLEVSRGDVVVFKDPGGWLPAPGPDTRTPFERRVADVLTYVGLLPQDSGEHLIKRIVGVPGDTVECCDEEGRLIVNGVAIDEPYLAAGAIPSEMDFSVEVPDGALWVMGDNRQRSQDSRYQLGAPGGGTVPVSDVVGVAVLTVWPMDRWTVHRNPGATFSEVR